jgi:hypothetical protein
MKLYKAILVFFCAWFIAPKFALALDVNYNKHQSIIKEISNNANPQLVLDVSDSDLEDDDDVENCTKKNTLHSISFLYNYLFNIHSDKLLNKRSIHFFDLLKSTQISTFLLLGNFRI